ncbi:hypothetical protein AVEN_227177-1 [Araneus ventricosus]|uniref:Uncharacterized protein n=1 Tax=Araneus ventricosus TaxID=182803 RepID=A0A4Y2BUT6_ARAVE|nr:hypothetical protein AVEN_227177-1 [Araneus ventricosus]
MGRRECQKSSYEHSSDFDPGASKNAYAALPPLPPCFVWSKMHARGQSGAVDFEIPNFSPSLRRFFGRVERRIRFLLWQKHTNLISLCEAYKKSAVDSKNDGTERELWTEFSVLSGIDNSAGISNLA